VIAAAPSDIENALLEIDRVIEFFHGSANGRQFIEQVRDLGMAWTLVARQKRNRVLDMLLRAAILIDAMTATSYNRPVAAGLVISSAKVPERLNKPGIITGQPQFGKLERLASKRQSLARPSLLESCRDSLMQFC
jgi:hypothetical protein